MCVCVCVCVCRCVCLYAGGSNMYAGMPMNLRTHAHIICVCKRTHARFHPRQSGRERERERERETKKKKKKTSEVESRCYAHQILRPQARAYVRARTHRASATKRPVHAAKRKEPDATGPDRCCRARGGVAAALFGCAGTLFTRPLAGPDRGPVRECTTPGLLRACTIKLQASRVRTWTPGARHSLGRRKGLIIPLHHSCPSLCRQLYGLF